MLVLKLYLMNELLKYHFDEVELSWYPWIGNDYKNGGIFDKKILILGESHYFKNKQDVSNKNFTRLTIQQKIGEAELEDGKFNRRAFHTKIFKAFNDLPLTNENIIRFWHSVAFLNYVQHSVGSKPRVKPSKNDWDNSFQPTLSAIKILNPEVIVVLGYRLWKNIWKRFDHEVYEETYFNNNRNIHKLNFGLKPLMFCIKHPSGGFSSNYFRPFISKHIIN